jgi:hypothetical protein
MRFSKVTYSELNSRQKENFNFQKVSAVLADYGFVTFRLTDDWQGADFLALRIDGEVLRVQLKSRLAFYEKYTGKDLFVAFGDDDTWYLYPHDELLATVLANTTVRTSASWKSGGYSFSRLSPQLRELLEPYRISGDARPVPESAA